MTVAGSASGDLNSSSTVTRPTHNLSLVEHRMDNASNPIHIVIADERPIFLQGLRRLLAALPGLRVVGEASDGSAVVTLTRQLKPQVLLLDGASPVCSELPRLKSTADPLSRVKIVVMLQTIEKSHVIEALRLGARGIVPRTATPTMLLSSIRDVASGNYAFGSEVITILVGMLGSLLADVKIETQLKDYSLTHRELEIIMKITAGLSNREVAELFSISERTVKHHLTNIFNKIGVSNRLALALFAVDHQLRSTLEPRRNGCGTVRCKVCVNGSYSTPFVPE